MWSEVLAPEHEALKCCSNFRKQASGKGYAHGYFFQMKHGGLTNRGIQFDVCQASHSALVQVVKERR